MIVLAMIALGWLTLMTLVVSCSRAARLGDRAQHEIPANEIPAIHIRSLSQPAPRPIRIRRTGVPYAARRIHELQRPF
jgi:hypothetical protein